MLQTPDEFEGVAEAPAPWNLHGKGLVVLLRGKADSLRADPRLPEFVRETLKTPLSLLMYVDYAHSSVGPYRELLYIPGTAQFSQQRLPTISNIVVSSAASVKNGRINWGIPKNLCDFEVTQGPEGLQEVLLSQQGCPQFELAFLGKGPALPVHTGILPGFLKTLGQRWQGKDYIYSPSARGSARLANVMALKSLGDQFPDLNLADVRMAFEITRFEMTFPIAREIEVPA